MSKDIDNIIEKLKKETNEEKDIVYRKKKINDEEIYIIYNESLTGNDKISDFIIRSIDSIDYKTNFKNNKKIDLYERIVNDISNFKVTEIKTYNDICYYLNNGFTIIIFKLQVFSIRCFPICIYFILINLTIYFFLL